MDATVITGIFRKLFDLRQSGKDDEDERIWVAGKFVRMTPPQARRFDELKRVKESADSD